MNNEPTQTKESVTTNGIPSTPAPATPVVPEVTKAQVPSPASEISEGFNLIPSMSEEEKVVEKAKSTVSIGSVLSLIVLVVIILVVVGFNIITKQILNSTKDRLYTVENRINQQVDKLIANEEIVDRAVLYANVKEGAFSHKAIIEFLSQMSTKVSNIEVRSIMISEELQFTFTGYATDLEKVSKLWYMLGINENIESINLQSVGKGENTVTFTFEGIFNGKNFFNK